MHGEHERPDGHYMAPDERAALGADVEDLDHLRCAAWHKKRQKMFLNCSIAHRRISARNGSCRVDKTIACNAVNQRFAQRMRERGMNLDLINTPGSHDWQGWNAAMPGMFKTAEKSLR
jgi:S-formylglutathione hydrolase FrmB